MLLVAAAASPAGGPFGVSRCFPSDSSNAMNPLMITCAPTKHGSDVCTRWELCTVTLPPNRAAAAAMDNGRLLPVCLLNVLQLCR